LTGWRRSSGCWRIGGLTLKIKCRCDRCLHSLKSLKAPTSVRFTSLRLLTYDNFTSAHLQQQPLPLRLAIVPTPWQSKQQTKTPHNHRLHFFSRTQLITRMVYELIVKVTNSCPAKATLVTCNTCPVLLTLCYLRGTPRGLLHQLCLLMLEECEGLVLEYIENGLKGESPLVMLLPRSSPQPQPQPKSR
jgi:hypothetical protein